MVVPPGPNPARQLSSRGPSTHRASASRNRVLYVTRQGEIPADGAQRLGLGRGRLVKLCPVQPLNWVNLMVEMSKESC